MELHYHRLGSNPISKERYTYRRKGYNRYLPDEDGYMTCIQCGKKHRDWAHPRCITCRYERRKNVELKYLPKLTCRKDLANPMYHYVCLECGEKYGRLAVHIAKQHKELGLEGYKKKYNIPSSYKLTDGYIYSKYINEQEYLIKRNKMRRTGALTYGKKINYREERKIYE